MPFYTPLRYPGGKRRLTATVKALLKENGLRDVQYAEPYAGGAAIALALLFEEYASIIHINDLSRPVYAFWHRVLNDNKELCCEIDQVEVTLQEWGRQRAIYDQRETANLSELGFATLFLNRTNRSGILGGGVIGGKGQTGKWSIDVRFNKAEMIQRIRKIGRYSDRIRVYQMDALDFINQRIFDLGPNSFTFFDPPYIEKGKGLYLNDYTVDGHLELAERIVELQQPWIVTYDYEAATRYGLYPHQPRFVYNLPYTAQSRDVGKEIMFLSDQLDYPRSWRSLVPTSVAASRTEYPLHGMMETP